MSDLHSSTTGDGPDLLLIHPTGASSEWLAPVASALSGSRRVIIYDRLGWGRSFPVGEYRKTSIAEQSIEAAGVLREHGVGRAQVAGVGFGAVVAIELALAEPDLIESALLIEPPLLDTLTDATEGMSRDVAAIREAAEEGGEAAVWQLFLDGGLKTLGAGAERLVPGAGGADQAEPGEGPGRLQADTEAGPGAAHALLVELPAVPAWPLDPVRVAGIEAPVTVATTPSTPDLLIRAADALVPRIPGAVRAVASQDGPLAIAELLS